MPRSIKFFLFFLLIITGFWSCKHETITPDTSFYNYFPSNIGHWIKYSVDSVGWDDYYAVTDPHHRTEYHYQIKEKIESYFYDIEGRNTMRIERYKRWNDTSEWFLKDVWYANLTTSTAEKVEENVRYVKLVFPIYKGRSWNGNVFNSLDEMEYKYDNMDQPYTVNGSCFDSTITVTQEDLHIVIFDKVKKEVYARNIGMIYKRYRDVEFRDTIYHDSITKGVDYTFKLIAFGN